MYGPFLSHHKGNHTLSSGSEYGSIIWDPYTQAETERLERVQRQAARFICGDYKSRNQGCVTKMLEKLKLPFLQDRRKQRLAFFYKIVERLVPAMPPHQLLEPERAS